MKLPDSHKAFIRHLEAATRYGSRSLIDVFTDSVHLMAQTLWRPLAGADGEAVEKDWRRTRQKYDDEAYGHITAAFSELLTALEVRREEFLGIILEHIGAANTHNGQFLTPQCVATLMARVTGEPIAKNHKPGEVITLNDPACGASVLLIEQAEQLRNDGVPQRDILIYAGDIDQRACDISFIELSLLGYAARIDHRDGLALKEYSKPRYTVGYFLHGMPLRLPDRKRIDANPTETAVPRAQMTFDL